MTRLCFFLVVFSICFRRNLCSFQAYLLQNQDPSIYSYMKIQLYTTNFRTMLIAARFGRPILFYCVVPQLGLLNKKFFYPIYNALWVIRLNGISCITIATSYILEGRPKPPTYKLAQFPRLQIPTSLVNLEKEGS